MRVKDIMPFIVLKTALGVIKVLCVKKEERAVDLRLRLLEESAMPLKSQIMKVEYIFIKKMSKGYKIKEGEGKKGHLITVHK